MRKIFVSLTILFVIGIFTGVAQSEMHDDIHIHKSCIFCGMDRGVFNFSRMLIEYDDGTTASLCSLHCAAIDLATNIDKTPKAIKVADFNGKQLIDAEKASWAVGGKKMGVMTKRGKWAFEKKDDAEAFVKLNGGEIVSFDQAMKMAYEDMYADTQMIREKRKMKRMKMEQKPKN